MSNRETLELTLTKCLSCPKGKRKLAHQGRSRGCDAAVSYSGPNKTSVREGRVGAGDPGCLDGGEVTHHTDMFLCRLKAPQPSREKW